MPEGQAHLQRRDIFISEKRKHYVNKDIYSGLEQIQACDFKNDD